MRNEEEVRRQLKLLLAGVQYYKHEIASYMPDKSEKLFIEGRKEALIGMQQALEWVLGEEPIVGE